MTIKYKLVIQIHHFSIRIKLNYIEIKFYCCIFFRAGSFDIEKFSISYEKSSWYEYFKCGIQGIRDKYPDIKLKGIKKSKRKFFDY